MALFVAHHTHPPDSCPASRDGGSALLTHVSAAKAARYRVAICAEALIDDEHRILFVLEAPDREAVEQFLAFLLPFGDLQVLPASTAEQAVVRGGCGTAKEAGRHTGAARSASVDARVGTRLSRRTSSDEDSAQVSAEPALKEEV